LICIIIVIVVTLARSNKEQKTGKLCGISSQIRSIISISEAPLM